jgi:hypothetical protein
MPNKLEVEVFFQVPDDSIVTGNNVYGHNRLGGHLSTVGKRFRKYVKEKVVKKLESMKDAEKWKEIRIDKSSSHCIYYLDPSLWINKDGAIKKKRFDLTNLHKPLEDGIYDGLKEFGLSCDDSQIIDQRNEKKLLSKDRRESTKMAIQILLKLEEFKNVK